MSHLRLVSNNPNPVEPSNFTKCAAMIRRAEMEIESAPASYFGEFDDLVPPNWPPYEDEIR